MVSDKLEEWNYISDNRVQAHPAILTLPSGAVMETNSDKKPM